jgi:NAD(P) transhydrogenase subunit alpha
MIAGVPKETSPGERRVALVPSEVSKLGKAGVEVRVEAGAGAAAGFADSAYVDKGAKIAGSRQELFSAADILLQVHCYGANPEAARSDLPLLRAGQAVIGFFDPLSAAKAVEEIAATGVMAFSMELMPRVTRAQSMDALSSQATIAGYKAVLLAADRLLKMFPMLMTAAGTVAPAKVLIIGAGVAGLQAIATARRLGGVVEAYDVRPAVKEQVESLGARFLELPLETAGAEDKSGYAKAQDEEFYRRQRELLTRAVAASDVVITTAAVPGKKAPVLITGEMVTRMAAGSVIMDVAAERGGNCELTRLDEVVVEQGVVILGPSNLPALVPSDASQMYARNISAFLLHMVSEGTFEPKRDDPIVNETMLTADGKVVHPRVLEILSHNQET